MWKKRTEQTAFKEISFGLVHTIYPNTPYTDSQELSFWSWSQKQGFKRENNCFNLLFQSSQFLLLVKRKKKAVLGNLILERAFTISLLRHFTLNMRTKAPEYGRVIPQIRISWIYWYYCSAMVVNYSTHITSGVYSKRLEIINWNNCYMKQILNTECNSILNQTTIDLSALKTVRCVHVTLAPRAFLNKYTCWGVRSPLLCCCRPERK